MGLLTKGRPDYHALPLPMNSEKILLNHTTITIAQVLDSPISSRTLAGCSQSPLLSSPRSGPALLPWPSSSGGLHRGTLTERWIACRRFFAISLLLHHLRGCCLGMDGEELLILAERSLYFVCSWPGGEAALGCICNGGFLGLREAILFLVMPVCLLGVVTPWIGTAASGYGQKAIDFDILHVGGGTSLPSPKLKPLLFLARRCRLYANSPSVA